MSDTLTNALQQSAHSSTVLQGLMNPATLNPLAGMGSAISAVQGMQGLAAKQGEQLVGQALQQATDPESGVLDTQKAQRIAAGMGPNAAYAMQDFLKTGSQLREQIIQAGNLYGVAGRLAASAAGDPSDANMAKIRAQGVALGLPPSGLAEIDRISALPVEQRSAEALKHTLGAIDALQRMHYQQGGVPTSWETGGGYQGGTYDPVTGALRPAGANVPKTLTPGEATGLDNINIGNGQVIEVPHALVPDLLAKNPGWKAIVAPSGGGALNNPLNIRSPNGGFASFATPEAGQAATDALFGKYADSGINTLSGLISRWAPPSENDTAGYIARVAKATGLDPNAPINLKDPAVARRIQQAMAVVEGNRNATPPAAPSAQPAAPAGPPGVQMGGQPPAPPGGAAGPYTGGGIGTVLAPPGQRSDATPPANTNVAAIMQGMQNARANPLLGGAMTAGPGAPTGNNALAGPSVELPPQPGWGAAVGSYSGGPGASPPAPAVPARPAVVAPAATAPPAPPSPTLGISTPPGQAEAQRITAEAAAKRGNDLVNQLTASSTVKPILAEMEDVLTKSGGTGFGTAHISAFRQALERLGLTPAAVDVATPQAALETFKKLSAQLQGAQLGTVGGVPTDDRQSLIEASNPSVLNSTAGNRSIIHVLQGTQQALETMGRVWMASPEYQKNPASFDDWRTKFTAKDPTTGGQFDPRAFWLNNMPPDEQHAYLRNMTPKGMAEFKKNWAYARSKGWVDPLPGQPATAAPGG